MAFFASKFSQLSSFIDIFSIQITAVEFFLTQTDDQLTPLLTYATTLTRGYVTISVFSSNIEVLGMLLA